MRQDIMQGTTPTHTFTVPFDTSVIKTARFVYTQDDEAKIIKEGDDVKLEGNEVSTTLTQEDTFLLRPCGTVYLLLRVLTEGGDAQTSDPVTLLCRGCADKEVLT